MLPTWSYSIYRISVYLFKLLLMFREQAGDYFKQVYELTRKYYKSTNQKYNYQKKMNNYKAFLNAQYQSKVRGGVKKSGTFG